MASSELYPAALIRDVRLVPIGSSRPEPAVKSLRIRNGIITEVSDWLEPTAEEQVYDGEGRWAIPGLWDAHVHMGQWATTLGRLNLAGTSSPEEVIERVQAHLSAHPSPPSQTLEGWGFRSATWSRQPTVAELDMASGERPVVLISGDLHNGWLNSAALRALGVSPTDAPLTEDSWFAVFKRLHHLPGANDASEAAYLEAVRQASSKGIVGIVDLELAANYVDWPTRFEAGVTGLRVRVATYADRLDEVIASGLTTGQPLSAGDGLLTMGPLKIISDGSLNTGTAFCCEPYAASPGAEPQLGQRNLSQRELEVLLKKATSARLHAAVHAIGDAAFSSALDAFERSGAKGSIEHAQLVATHDLPRMARLGIGASVQPAHLLDDRDPTLQIWPDRADRCFAFRSMLDAGVRLAMGSDAPVSPLDPWLTMAAAVHRSADEREPWHPEQALPMGEALAASVDGQGTLAPGSRADIAVLDQDPLADEGQDSRDVARRLREMTVAATFLAGRPTYG